MRINYNYETLSANGEIYEILESCIGIHEEIDGLCCFIHVKKKDSNERIIKCRFNFYPRFLENFWDDNDQLLEYARETVVQALENPESGNYVWVEDVDERGFILDCHGK